MDISKSKYDSIVIGAGIGGLLVSNMLALKGKKVLILEKNNFSGGYYGTFQNGEYNMDIAVSYFLGFNQKGLLTNFFKELNLYEKVNFKKIPIADRYIFPDFEYEFKSDYLMLISDLCSIFPNEKRGIETYFDLMKKIYMSFSNIGRIDPIIIKYLKVDYFTFLNDTIKDKRLKAILSARVFGSGVSLITMLSYLGNIIFGGLYQEMNHQNISQLLTNSFLENGGKILYNEKIESIIRHANKVQKVISNNNYFEADNFISACDMTKVFCDKFKPDIPQEIKDEILNRKKSLSSISIFIVLKKLSEKIINNPVGRIHIFNKYDIQKIYQEKECGILNVENGIKINIQHILDKDFKKKNKYFLRIEIDVKSNAISNETKLTDVEEKIIELVFDKLELNRDDILKSKILFPKDLEHLTFASKGAGSGWAPDTNYTDFSKYEEEIADNFYQSGCWDKYGSGIFQIFLSARRITKKILSEKHKV